jgi:hypothetical protein
LPAPSVVEAKPLTSSINFTFSNAYFSSILGGTMSGNATLGGTISADGTQLSELRGSANFPLRDPAFRASPTSSVQITVNSYQQYWFDCSDPSGCVLRTYTETFRASSVPVDVRFSGLRGNGQLWWSTYACTAGACPPGYTPGGYSNLGANVVGNKDGGSLHMDGPFTMR